MTDDGNCGLRIADCGLRNVLRRFIGGVKLILRPSRFISYPASLVLLILVLGGCSDPREKFGRTWYIDGAGNWGFGVMEVPVGLEEAGYRGWVTNHRWSMTINPMLDQMLRFVAKGSGEMLGGEITRYLEKHPEREANIIALSAGTGVGIWAIESITPPAKLNNFVMVGSSLSSRYDARKALRNMKGKIYVYHSSTDPVLQGPVRLLGTIDGTFDDSAGLVGLRGPGGGNGRIVNISRRSAHAHYGWTGGHADCTNRRFVSKYISRHIVPRTRASTGPGSDALARGYRGLSRGGMGDCGGLGIVDCGLGIGVGGTTTGG